MMMPPFAVSFSPSLRTSTRSCNGVTFTVISLASAKSAFNAPKPIRYNAALGAKALLVLLPSKFDLVRYLLLTRDCSLWGFQFVHSHYFRKRCICFGSDSFGVND